MRTPGEWSVGGQEGNEVVGDRSDGDPIATAWAMGCASLDEMRANARLIAAAPDLYDALKQCQQHMNLFASPTDAVTQAVNKLVNDALAKAGG